MRKINRVSTRIILMVLLITGLTFTFAEVFRYGYVRAEMTEKVVGETRLRVRLMADRLSDLQEHLHKEASTLIVNRELNDLLNAELVSPLQEYGVKSEVERLLGDLAAVSAYGHSYIIVRDDGQIYSNTRRLEPYYREVLEEAWYRDMLEGAGQTHFSGVHTLYVDNDVYNPVITYHIDYVDINNKRSHRFQLLMNIRQAQIRSMLSLNGSDSGFVLLRNGNGDLLYSGLGEGDSGLEESLQRLLPPGGRSDLEEDANYIYLRQRAQYDNWEVLSIISKEELYRPIHVYGMVVALITAISFACIVLLVWGYVNRKLQPLVELKEAMLRTPQEETFLEHRHRSEDEVGILWQAFATMRRELQASIGRIVEAEKHKQKVTMDLLMARINPHFIYNTLNTVIYLVEAKRGQDAIRTTEALISMLQDVIQIGGDRAVVTVEEELRIIRLYLVIQGYRYPGRFQVVYDIQPAAARCLIPKMCLEPIVENAIFHGMYNLDNQGTIRVAARREDGQITVCIRDNGIGMSPETLRKVLEGEAAEQPFSRTRGIGISNIRERIRTMYGEEGCFLITSAQGEGTIVTMTFPAEEDGTA